MRGWVQTGGLEESFVAGSSPGSAKLPNSTKALRNPSPNASIIRDRSSISRIHDSRYMVTARKRTAFRALRATTRKRTRWS